MNTEPKSEQEVNSTVDTSATTNNTSSAATNASTKVVENTAENTPEATANKNRRLNLNKKQVLTVIGLGLLAIVIVTLVLFIPIQGQSAISRTLDQLGFHKQSMGLDLATNGGLQKVYLNDIQTGRNCANPGKGLSQDVRILQTAGTSKTTISTIDQKYSDDLKLDLSFVGTINADQKATFANLKAEGQLSEKIVGEDKANSNEKYSLKFDASNITTTESSFLRLDRLAIGSPELNSDNSLKDWYKGDLPYPEKNGVDFVKEVNNIVDNVDQITTFNTAEILSEDTLKELAKQNCQVIGNIDVLKTTTMQVNDTDQRVRPIRVNIDLDKALSSSASNQELVMKAANDPKLEQYILAQFDQVDSILTSAEKIAPAEREYDFDAEPVVGEDGDREYPMVEKQPELRVSKEFYEEQVKSFFKENRESATRENTNSTSSDATQQALDGIRENVDIRVFVDAYFDVTTTDLVSYNTVVELRFKDKAFEGDSSISSYTKDLLKSGVRITQTSTATTATQIEIPTEFKNIDQFQEDAKVDDSFIRDLPNPLDIINPRINDDARPAELDTTREL